MTPLDYYVDFSFSQPPPATIKAAGYGGAAIYLDAALPDAAYIQQLRDLGLKIILIREAGVTDAYGGFQVGVNFAVRANTRADMIGAPGDATIAYVVADTPYTNGDQAAAVSEFARGVASVSGRPAGYYGNMSAIRATPGWFWGVETWSDTRNGLAGWDGFGAAMIQMANSRVYSIPGYDTDENRVYIENFGQWGASSPPQAQDPLPVNTFTQGATMLKFTDTNGTACEFFASGSELFVRYWKNGALSEPIKLSDDVDPGSDLLPISAVGITLVHAPSKSQPGKLVEAYPSIYGYLGRVV